MDANVSTLVTQYSNGAADLTAAQEFYDDIVSEILANYKFLTNFSTGLAVSSNNQVALPTALTGLLALFYQNEQLGPLSINEANFLLPDWRQAPGPVKNWIPDTSNKQTITLCPRPSTPASTASAIYTETRQTLPTYLQLPVALIILYYEYSRESDHRDLNLAQAFKALGEFLLTLVMYPKQEDM